MFSSFGFTGVEDITQESRSSWTVSSIDLVAGLGDALSGDIWSYEGSLPVPPCHENIKWMVAANKLSVADEQIDQLMNKLTRYASVNEVYNKRPMQAMNGRTLYKNAVPAMDRHDMETCEYLNGFHQAHRTSQCFHVVSDTCHTGHSQSPINIDTEAAASGTSTAATELIFYGTIPKAEIRVGSTDYTLDAVPVDLEGDNGHVVLHGRMFTLADISVRAGSEHKVDGTAFEAEIVIEHVMFGDKIAEDHHHSDYHPKVHKLMVSIPIRHSPSTAESVLLRQLGIGNPSFKQTIRDHHTYQPVEDVDLAAGLASAFSGDWYLYNGSTTYPSCEEDVKWIVFTTPIEASRDQINFLHTWVPGPESIRMPQELHGRMVHENFVPDLAADASSVCSSDDSWSYANPDCWGEIAPVCKTGSRQSPINVDTASASKVGNDNFLHLLRWRPIDKLRVVNTGTTLEVQNHQMGYLTYVGANGFPDYYQLHAFHLKMPSEHFLDGLQHAAELQIVHARQISIEELDGEDLITVSIFFDIGETESPFLRQMFLSSDGPSPPAADNYNVISLPVDLMRAFGPQLEGNFYTYNGSMTTPPCLESVKWHIFETPSTMSVDQWVAFKTLFGNPMNNRPVVSLSGRPLAMNSLQSVEEDAELNEFRFWLSRSEGRNRLDPGVGWILVPITGTLILCLATMCAVFVQAERKKVQARSPMLAEPMSSA